MLFPFSSFRFSYSHFLLPIFVIPIFFFPFLLFPFSSSRFRYSYFLLPIFLIHFFLLTSCFLYLPFPSFLDLSFSSLSPPVSCVCCAPFFVLFFFFSSSPPPLAFLPSISPYSYLQTILLFSCCFPSSCSKLTFFLFSLCLFPPSILPSPPLQIASLLFSFNFPLFDCPFLHITFLSLIWQHYSFLSSSSPLFHRPLLSFPSIIHHFLSILQSVLRNFTFHAPLTISFSVPPFLFTLFLWHLFLLSLFHLLCISSFLNSSSLSLLLLHLSSLPSPHPFQRGKDEHISTCLPVKGRETAEVDKGR